MNNTTRTPNRNLIQLPHETPVPRPATSPGASTGLKLLQLNRGIVTCLIAAACLATATLSASGAIISGTRIGFSTGNPPSADYSAGITQTLAGNGPADSTSAIFTYAGTTLAVFTVAADEGCDWYLARSGQIFSGAGSPAVLSILNGTNAQGNYIFASPASIPLGDFYLAVATGTGFTNGKPNRNVFGWIELHNTGTQLIPVANAVAYSEPGIIIGSATPIPEPSTLLLAAASFGILLARRR